MVSQINCHWHSKRHPQYIKTPALFAVLFLKVCKKKKISKTLQKLRFLILDTKSVLRNKGYYYSGKCYECQSYLQMIRRLGEQKILCCTITLWKGFFTQLWNTVKLISEKLKHWWKQLYPMALWHYSGKQWSIEIHVFTLLQYKENIKTPAGS